MENTHLDSADPTPQPPPDSLQELRSLGDYRILRRLGEGGMGAVYLGYHARDHHQVAIKVLGDHLASNASYIDRFYREAKSGRLLNHPNIVRTLDSGQDRLTAKHYLILEFVDGPTAHALLANNGPLPVGDVVHIALDIARALEHAHSRNIVHRDIKPDNILITRSGVSKLVDLGLARRLDEASHLTAARQGFGTTHYMPYEQAINARHADNRSDIYALGGTLYHLATGCVPFPGENHLDIVEKKNQGEFTPASRLNPAVPPALDQILARMLARHPRDRYQTASELIIDLERSRLAAPVPSFADPAQALLDPWIQKCLAPVAEPTRLDPEAPPRPSTLAGPDDIWLLRFTNRAGRPCKARATTTEIVERLRGGRLSLQAEGRRPGQKTFQALALYPEFKDIQPPRKPAARRRPARVVADSQPTLPSFGANGKAGRKPEVGAEPARRPWLLPVLGAGGVALVVLIVLMVCKLLT